MVHFLIVYAMLLDNPVPSIPSHVELAEAVIANREKIRTLHVRTHSRRMPQRTEVRKELYLDADAYPWRIDTTGLRAAGLTPAREEPVVYSSSTSANGAVAYLYDPTNPQMAARKDWLAGAMERLHVRRFPDPRNAGLVPSTHGNTASPSEISGGDARACLHTFYVNSCLGAERVAIEPVTWNEQSCWRVESQSAVSATQRNVCTEWHLNFSNYFARLDLCKDAGVFAGAYRVCGGV